MADVNEVALPFPYYPDPSTGRPVFNGSIYVGIPDTDPQITSNQLPVKAFQENGGSVAISQPIHTGAGGVAMLNGSPVQLQVDGEYSIKVLNNKGAQVYYAASLVGAVRPTTIVRQVALPVSISLTNRFVNSYLFNSNTSWAEFYAAETPNVDLGMIGVAPFDIENIPPQRFDLAQNTSSTDLGTL